MRACLIGLAFMLVYLIAMPRADAQSLQMGLAVDVVPVGSDFNGTNLVIFGSIEGAQQAPLYRGEYDVVITIKGAEEDVVIRQKQWVLGIWINRFSKRYVNIPSYYTVVSRNPLQDITSSATLRQNGIGIEYLGIKPDVQGDLAFQLQAGEFSNALRRIRSQENLFSEKSDGLEQLSPTLYRATVFLPPNVPIGRYVVTSHLFKDGELLATNESGFRIEKIGFERFMYNAAHENGLAYGILAVLIAIATGWIANLVFRRS